MTFLRFAVVASLVRAAPILAQVSGESVIRAPAGPSEIVVTTTDRLAGAIHSLTWNGKEFIDSADHGRQLQSASSFSDGKQAHWAESCNPTEAGSRKDGAGTKSTSKLLFLKSAGAELQTTSRMAFWLTPEEKSQGHAAMNRQILSDHLLTKRVKFGYDGNPHIIAYDVTFSTPVGERWAYNQFEALTGYMPKAFSKFRMFNKDASAFEDLSDGPGEQSLPIALATEDGGHAMGIFAKPVAGFTGPGYGRFRFDREKVVKWNAVFRKRDEAGLKPGDYSFSMFVLVGSLEDVRKAFVQLHK